MGKQIILCVETNKQADTDSTYIMDAIRHNYVIDNSVKISKIIMERVMWFIVLIQIKLKAIKCIKWNLIIYQITVRTMIVN